MHAHTLVDMLDEYSLAVKWNGKTSLEAKNSLKKFPEDIRSYIQLSVDDQGGLVDVLGNKYKLQEDSDKP